jgi:hypothetical protein
MSDKTFPILVGLTLTAAGAAAEERVVVRLSVDQHRPSLCSITVSDLDKNRIRYMEERPGDGTVDVVNRFTSRLAGLKVCGKVGSELRVSGTATLTNTDPMHTWLAITTVKAEGKERLCFRKTARFDWAYLCGRGVITGKTVYASRFSSDQERRPERLGWDRTVDSCLSALSSTDEIVREGCARDLARLTSDSDRARVLPRLSALLSDPVPEVRRGAAEALALLGGPESFTTIKAARVAEKDKLTKEYFDEALALLGGAALLRENRDAGIPAAEAAESYNAGRDAWVNDMLAQPSGAQGPAESVLKGRLGAQDPKERLAAVRLVKAVKPPWAQEALTQVAEKDSDALVKVAAKLALDGLRDGK